MQFAKLQSAFDSGFEQVVTKILSNAQPTALKSYLKVRPPSRQTCWFVKGQAHFGVKQPVTAQFTCRWLADKALRVS